MQIDPASLQLPRNCADCKYCLDIRSIRGINVVVKCIIKKRFNSIGYTICDRFLNEEDLTKHILSKGW